ncbi:hypothetical protein CSA80_03490 [Candidatus Saccharibacteria bacterium]|nr:MAG: hypothetical protein CSA80_03490 [Candidatus Saccharibacteria bacterium]
MREKTVRKATGLPRKLLAGKLPDYIVAAVLLLVPFQAFLAVAGAKVGGNYTLLRLVPEFALLILLFWLVFSGRLKLLWQQLSGQKLAWLVAAYLIVNLVYYGVSVAVKQLDVQAAAYGLLLNTRHVVWFAAVCAVGYRSNWLRRNWQPIALIPLAAVSVFAVLQFFVLPPDFLGHFGYQKGITISPAHTINQDTETIRAQSFLRGPNPLGAYLLVGIGLVWIAAFSRVRKYAFAVLVLAALFLSFSRSAWLGLIMSGLVWLTVTKGVWRNARENLLAAVAVAASLGILLLFLQTNHGVQNAIFHVNDRSTAELTSNEGRVAALQQGLGDVVNEPLGRGLGTAGPASMLEDTVPARNSENYFLGLGQEIGWLGMGLFIAICLVLSKLLYRQKTVLAWTMLATLVGLTLVNLLSYAWADVTLAYLWWGLAAIALTGSQKKEMA